MTIELFLWTTVVLLAIGACGGLIMAGVRLFGQTNPPAWLSMVHGLLAAAGLTLLLFAAFTIGLPLLAVIALILLLLAACGGAVMNLVYQWQRKLLPKPLMAGHIALAVAGFILVIIAAV